MGQHIRRLSLLALAAHACCAAAQTPDDASVLELDLSQLGNVAVPQSATITPTTSRRVPASITVIDRQMIRDTGARNLFDLLETYVPSFHYLPHHWEAPHMGMRGLIGDREDKYLIVLNGRVLNERTHFGAMSERDLPMLDDIQRIDVVRGPGSVVYGPGAVSMVISIQTESYSDTSADGATVKLGAVEQFQSLEAKKRIALGDERHGLLLYAGIANYDGASPDDAPVVYGNTFNTAWGQQVKAGEAAPFDYPNNHAAFRDQPKLKLHADYQLDNFRAWLRFTRGGEELAWEHKVFGTKPIGSAAPGTSQSAIPDQGVGYQQLTLDMSQRWTLSPAMSLELKGGYDSFDYERVFANVAAPWNQVESHREEQYLLRATLSGQASESQSLAAGVEYAYSRYGLKSPGYPDAAPYSSSLGLMSEWGSAAYGVFAEHQWQVSDTLTNFLGLRADKDDYTEWMWSPRWSLVYAPNETDTLKSVVSRSVRKNNAEELRKQHLAGQLSTPEQLQGVELIYQHAFSRALKLDLSAYYNDVEVIGFNSATLAPTAVANFTYGGIELELEYKTDALHLSFSHAYTKLDHFEVEPGARQKISVANLGYGNDLSNWSNHMSKLAAVWQANADWRLSGAVRVFWGYPGSQDTTQATNDINNKIIAGPYSSTAVSDPGYTDSFKEAVFLDLGASCRVFGHDTVALNAYNVLGWVDSKYNKRMYLIDVSNYRAEAPAVALTYRHAF
ncbi:TonB-dependent receptor plug domain-containing protein [Niveibacterium sp.]|uniref:TonB-dependent receptor plug domain-containing protein n=1 Tax=Niveibacterium sp. TaxID=2017444 RepID=UPI0035B40C37